MEFAKVIQALWAGFFVFLIGFSAAVSGLAGRMIIVAFAVAYMAAAIACLWNSRVGWIIALLIPILPIVRWTPMIALNFWMFINGHELYQDSPGTIIVVAINAILFVLPGILIYFCVFLDWKRFIATFWPAEKVDLDCSSASLDSVLQDTSNPYQPPEGQ